MQACRIQVPATTVNKMCGSAMKAIMIGADQIAAGSARLVVAGGLESMSNAPYLLPKARSGYRMGHGELLDHMFYDGLQSPWDGKLMGCFADATAEKYGMTRAAQDAFATESVRRAMRALQAGEFDAEIAPVSVKARKGVTVVARDETPGPMRFAKIAQLKPAFGANGTVTAASSSSISDGAAALVLRARRGREAGAAQAGGAPGGLGEQRAGAGVVHDCTGGGDRQGAQAGRLERRMTSTCSRSTKPLRSSPWRPCTI